MKGLGKLKKCFIIAEISANHGQSLNRAISMIKKARDVGADAVKFQTYTPDTLTVDVDNKHFRVKHPKWGGQTLYQLYKKAYTPWKWFPKLKKVADEEGITFFSTAFDKTSVDLLEDLKVPFHKVASFEIVDLPLIEYMAKTKKPLIISTGIATLDEIADAVNTAKKYGSKKIVLLKCVSGYPAEPREMNLKAMPYLADKFKVQVGLSDHTMGIGVSAAAVSLGARVIEKHFTLSRKIKTADSFFSLEPEEFKQLVSNIRIIEDALGDGRYSLTQAQRRSRVFKRSLYITKNIKKGEKLNYENIRSIRPGFGLETKHIKKVIGKRARTAIKKGTALKLSHIK